MHCYGQQVRAATLSSWEPLVKKRTFLLLGIGGLAALGIVRLSRIQPGIDPDMASLTKPLAIDPERQKFLYLDGWITEVSR